MDVIQSDSELALHNSLNQLRGDIKVEVEKMKKASSRQLPPKELSEIELD